VISLYLHSALPGEMRFKIFHFLAFLFLIAPLAAQEPAAIEGYVTGLSKTDTIAGATISIDSIHVTTSNAQGFYSLTVQAGTYALNCRLTGFEFFRKTVTLKAGDKLRLDIKLRENANPLTEVVVSTERYPQKLGEVTVSTEIIKPALIENKNITQLDQVLNQVPGVVVNDGQASIRGGSGFSYGAGSRVLMLMDEIPLISADASDIKWNYLPLENLEQVEVVKGASSVLYGSGALNGTINFRTAFARNEPQTKATLFYGSYDAPRHTYKWWKGSSQSQKGFNFSHAQKIGNLDLVLGAHHFNDDGFRMLETESRERFNANLKYSFKKLPRLNVGTNVNMMNSRGGLFFLWYNYDSAYVPQGNNIQRYNNTRMNVDPWITWTGTNGDISLRNRYFKTVNTNDKNQGSYAELYYSELRYTKKFRRLNITGGLVRMEQVVLGDSIYGNHRGKNIAGYLQLSAKVTRNLNITAGARGEYYKIDSAKTTGYLYGNSGPKLPFQPVFRLGLNYHAAKYTYLTASFGQGYRFPSVAEKFVNTSVSLLKIFPNPSLQPERAYSAEVSIKQGFALDGFRGYFDLAGFYTRYHNMIEFVFDIYKPGGVTGNFIDDVPWAGFKSQNIGEAQISGAELSLNGSGKIGPVKTTVFSGYTYINPIQYNYDPQRDTLGLPGVKTLKYRSKHLFKADVQFEYKRWAIGYSARYQSKIENIDRRFVMSVLEEYSGSTGVNFSNYPSTYILPGLKENYGAFSKSFVIQDVRISFRLSEQVKISFIVNNIGNVEYQSRPGDMRPPTMYLGQVMVKI
jgi:outer membrane receptor protein involved in Fe transport